MSFHFHTIHITCAHIVCSIYIYIRVLDTMFCFEFVFFVCIHDFTSEISATRFHACACAWFRSFPLESENHATRQRSLTTPVSDFGIFWALPIRLEFLYDPTSHDLPNQTFASHLGS